MDLSRTAIMEPRRALERAEGEYSAVSTMRSAPARRFSPKQSIEESRALKMVLDPNLLLDLKFLSLIMFDFISYPRFQGLLSAGYPFKFTIPNQVN